MSNESLAKLALAKREEAQLLQCAEGDASLIESLLTESHQIMGLLAEQGSELYLMEHAWASYYLARRIWDDDRYAEARAINEPALAGLEHLSGAGEAWFNILSLLINQQADILAGLMADSGSGDDFIAPEDDFIAHFEAMKLCYCRHFAQMPILLHGVLLDVERILAIHYRTAELLAMSEAAYLRSLSHAEILLELRCDTDQQKANALNDLYCAIVDLADLYCDINRPDKAAVYAARARGMVSS